MARHGLLATMLCVLCGVAPGADTAVRRVAFWPDAVLAAIQSEIDGNAALDVARTLGRFHRVQGSPGFTEAAEFIQQRAKAAGLADATVEHYPADGQTRYAHFQAYFGWEATEASLEEIAPMPQPMARFPALSVALADYSQDADATGDLVDVGDGTSPGDYKQDVAGKMVLASGELAAVHGLAVLERGAAGILSDFPNQRSAWSGDDRDLVRWGHLSPYETRNRFAFMLSKRQSEELRARLRAGAAIVLHARVRAKLRSATFDVVNATIQGTDPDAGEVVLAAHLCHQAAGANDNASGSAALLETARAVAAAIAKGALPRPQRTIRFLWVPEMAGSQAWLIRNPQAAHRLVAGVVLDMVGGRPEIIKGTLHVSRTAESLPHAVNAIAAAFLDEVKHASAARAEQGGSTGSGFVWAPGSRNALEADMRRIELGSDHQIFQDGSFRVPMVYFHDWPDVTIHTNKDVPENLDPTKLGRVVYLSAGIAWTLAALPDAEVSRLIAVVRADAEHRLVDAKLRASLSGNDRDGLLAAREAAASGGEALRSVAVLWKAGAAEARSAAADIERDAPSVPPLPGVDLRVPVRSDDIRGALDVFYFDTIADRLRGARSPNAATLYRPVQSLPEVCAYEAFNLVDGRRSVGDIRDVLTGRYGAVASACVAEYFDQLAKASIIRWQRTAGPR
jgi:aminopeptidase YwaD